MDRVKFMAREPEFPKRLYLKHIPVQSNKYLFIFSVPVGSAKKSSQVQFQSDVPTLAYQSHDQNSFCFSISGSDSLASK